jgi:hypothetical protein
MRHRVSGSSSCRHRVRVQPIRIYDYFRVVPLIEASLNTRAHLLLMELKREVGNVLRW